MFRDELFITAHRGAAAAPGAGEPTPVPAAPSHTCPRACPHTRLQLHAALPLPAQADGAVQDARGRAQVPSRLGRDGPCLVPTFRDVKSRQQRGRRATLRPVRSTCSVRSSRTPRGPEVARRVAETVPPTRTVGFRPVRVAVPAHVVGRSTQTSRTWHRTALERPCRPLPPRRLEGTPATRDDRTPCRPDLEVAQTAPSRPA